MSLASLAMAAPPKLDLLFPAGAARGATVTVSASGSFDNWPVRAWTDRPGVKIEAGEKGKLTFTVAEDVVPGVCWVRLFHDEGASDVRPFVIGTLAEVVEVEPNNEAAKPQAIGEGRVTVNGRFESAGDVDVYSVPLKQGETLVASLLANQTLGSPLDGVLQVLSPQGFVLAQNDDEHGLDPQIAFTAPADGKYLVRTFAFPATPDSTIGFSGGSNFLYRLTLTTGGFVDHSWPLAVSQTQSTDVQLFGWNIPNDAKRQAIAADDSPGDIVLFHPQLANTLAVSREPHAVAIEVEPNDAQHPQPLTPPVTLTGRIDPARDEDVFSFTAKKGETVVFRVESDALGYPLDPVLTLNDATRKNLARVDDARSGRSRRAESHDCELSFTASADGEYRLTVADLHRRGGFRYVYKLTAAAPQPDYQLTLAADAFVLTPGKPLEIPVTIDRRQNFAGEIEITATGLPEGVTCPPVKSLAKGDTAKTVKLVLMATEGPRSGPIRIAGQVTGELKFARTAHATVAGLNARIADVWLTVAKPHTEK